ncbi:MAG TPA: ubiquinone/menaquinone biosynthesis methyltransferase [Desulfobacterales bacterium]|nr:ubiquinone/menaquinone biosynthesis methyltransferase [Desulfobacterales bacterium]
MDISSQQKKRFVKKTFSGISPNYDLVNSITSFFIDHYWRAKAIRALDATPGDLVLDLCSGTMPLAKALLRRVKVRIVCLDISQQMLVKGIISNGSLRPFLFPICGDAENLPFPDHTFDAAMVAFGIRNLSDLNAGLTELCRVIKPGGTAVILEFSRPQVPVFSQIYRLYLKNILIPLGATLTRDRQAYEYLVSSIYEFYAPSRVKEFLYLGGFTSVSQAPLTAGCVSLYTAHKKDGFYRSRK